MVRTYKRKRQTSYSEVDLRRAVESVQGGMTISEASRTFSIPRGTITDNMKSFLSKKKSGGKTIFTLEQEMSMKDRILYLSSRGFPVTADQLCKIAYSFAEKLRRRKKLQMNSIPRKWNLDGKASNDWYLGYKRRHSDLVLRTPEGISTARAEAFNPKRVSKFFEDARQIYDKFQFFNFPSQIYNVDETGLSSVPSNSIKVIAKKGTRTVQQVQVGERGTLTTLVACVSATGSYIPPFLIFKGSVPSEGMLPQNSYTNSSKSGYIDSDLFIDFLVHFDKYREKINNQPCLLVLDGHASHMSLPAVSFAKSHNIELLCLPPHTSHRLQPLDTHINKKIKTEWRKNLTSFLQKNDRIVLTKNGFTEVFSETWKAVIENRGLALNAFTYCGLYPLRNTVLDEEYEKSRAYDSNESQNATFSGETAAALRTICTSPKKLANKVHKKDHLAHTTSEEYIKLREGKSRALPSSSSTSITASKALPSSSSTSISVSKTLSSSSSTSIPASKSLTSNCARVPPFTKGSKARRTTSSHTLTSIKTVTLCCVCSVSYDEATEDWYQCTKCLKWACEVCFATNVCANCCA
jgi:hypothetical protein